MADITSRRGPVDPSEGLSNQGVATQAMLNSMAKEQQYELTKKLNKKSTWDKIVGGVQDVVNIGKGVMDIANSYEDLQVKEEQIKASEVGRQRSELALEKDKQTLNMQSIQNAMQLREIEEDNKFLDTINEYIKAGDTEGGATYALSHPKLSNKYQSALFHIANQLDKSGDADSADAFRLSASTGDKTLLANLMYGPSSMSVRRNFANPQQYIDYKRYEAKVNALESVFSSADNADKVAKLGLGKSKNLPQDLLSCAMRISTTNTMNENSLRQEWLKGAGVKSIDNIPLPPNSTGKNVQFLNITCHVDGKGRHTEQFVFDANSKVLATSITSKGLPGEEKAISIGAAISSLISQHKKFTDLVKTPVRNTPIPQQTNQSTEVIDQPNVQAKAQSDTTQTSSVEEAQVTQQEAVRPENYTKDTVYKELKNLSQDQLLNDQAKGAVVENKVLEMSRVPDVLNSFIHGPVTQLLATMTPVEKEALQMYVKKMGIPVKQEIARTIATYIVQNGKDISQLIKLIKPIIERSKVYQDILSEVTEPSREETM